jgi:cysteine synthase A
MKMFNDNSYTIGKTPLVRIQRVAGNRATVLGKIESRNPLFSVKCRIGAGMIWDAEERGVLKSGMEIIEPTSGNTGIALAFTGAARGYPVTLTMPDTMSIERHKILAALGARLVLTPGAQGMAGAIDKAAAIAEENPERYFMPQQFKNPANPGIHFKTTGPEIWDDTRGDLDVLVAGVGTGGTLTGISRYIKVEKKCPIISVAVEPSASPVISQHLANKKLSPGPHKIQGIGAGFIPDNLDCSLIDRVEKVTDNEAFDFARRTAREEGILVGISCGAALAAAARLAQNPEFEGKTIVVILPDSGERYLSVLPAP